MSTAQHILGLLRSHIAGNQEQFYSVAMQVAAHEAKLGHVRLAQELREMIDAARSTVPSAIKEKKRNAPIPLATPKGELSTLIEVGYSEIRLASMVLPNALQERLHRVLTEQRQKHRLAEYGLNPRRKLLLVGQPGCGKTMTASALAGELHLPLFTVLLDGLITKFMGETASKLRLVFEAMQETKGVYFFDEFDALGSKRSEKNDVGEIRRVLNSFLQFLEKDDSEGLVIAATNHPELLDPALFRRFDDVIEYRLPDDETIERILEARLGIFKPKGINWRNVCKTAQGLSQAELVRAAEETVKQVILHEGDSVTETMLLESLTERKQAAERQYGM
jgi:SpoVK/Ycf46/Vps4 family AAA+-type ATPase